MKKRAAIATRCGRAAVLAVVVLLGAFAAAGAAAPAGPLNRANDKLMKLKPAERAAELARAVGHWCVGTQAFLMGVLKSGPGEGNAYWSLRCADGTAWAIQIDSLGEVTAIDCASYKAVGDGKQCFKKF